MCCPRACLPPSPVAGRDRRLRWPADGRRSRCRAAQARLAQALAGQGRRAGRSAACRTIAANDMEVIDSDTILFRDGRTIYVQHTNGGCYPDGRSAATRW